MKNSFKTCFETDFFSLEEKKFETGKPYYRYNSDSSAISVVLDAEDNLILVRQYRENLETETLEFPAGGIESGETPKEAVIREVYEEAGLNIKTKYLGKGYLLMNRCKNPEHLFFGYENTSYNKVKSVSIKTEFPIVKIPRLDFARRLIDEDFQQLGALSIITLIDCSFNVRFLADPHSSLLEKGLIT